MHADSDLAYTGGGASSTVSAGKQAEEDFVRALAGMSIGGDSDSKYDSAEQDRGGDASHAGGGASSGKEGEDSDDVAASDAALVGVVVCGVCHFLEFPGCSVHHRLLTVRKASGHVACAARMGDPTTEGALAKPCAVATDTARPWVDGCRACRSPSTSVHVWRITLPEAECVDDSLEVLRRRLEAAGDATVDVIAGVPHTARVCDMCRTVDFPAVSDAGLTMATAAGDFCVYNEPGKVKPMTSDGWLPQHAPDCVNVGTRTNIRQVRVLATKEEAAFLRDRLAVLLRESSAHAGTQYRPKVQVVSGEATLPAGAPGVIIADRGDFPTISAHCNIRGGRWFYEVEVLTGGLMQVGWAGNGAEVNAGLGRGVGDDSFSWAFDGNREYLWHRATRRDWGRKWKAGDVLGCAVDLDNGLMLWGLNGDWREPMGIAVERVAAPNGIVPALSLHAGEAARLCLKSDEVRFGAPGTRYRPIGEAATAWDATPGAPEAAVFRCLPENNVDIRSGPTTAGAQRGVVHAREVIVASRAAPGQANDGSTWLQLDGSTNWVRYSTLARPYFELLCGPSAKQLLAATAASVLDTAAARTGRGRADSAGRLSAPRAPSPTVPLQGTGVEPLAAVPRGFDVAAAVPPSLPVPARGTANSAEAAAVLLATMSGTATIDPRARGVVVADGGDFVSVAAHCRVTKGKFYYECHLLTGGLMQIGWAAPGFAPDAATGRGVGDCAASWGFDGERCLMWHRAERREWGRRWRAGDVLGCSVDFASGDMMFSLNGDWSAPMGLALTRLSAADGLVPCATLQAGQACRFACNAAEWRWSPPGLDFRAVGAEATSFAASPEGPPCAVMEVLETSINIRTAPLASGSSHGQLKPGSVVLACAAAPGRDGDGSVWVQLLGTRRWVLFSTLARPYMRVLDGPTPKAMLDRAVPGRKPAVSASPPPPDAGNASPGGATGGYSSTGGETTPVARPTSMPPPDRTTSGSGSGFGSGAGAGAGAGAHAGAASGAMATATAGSATGGGRPQRPRRRSGAGATVFGDDFLLTHDFAGLGIHDVPAHSTGGAVPSGFDTGDTVWGAEFASDVPSHDTMAAHSGDTPVTPGLAPPVRTAAGHSDAAAATGAGAGAARAGGRTTNNDDSGSHAPGDADTEDGSALEAPYPLPAARRPASVPPVPAATVTPSGSAASSSGPASGDPPASSPPPSSESPDESLSGMDLVASKLRSVNLAAYVDAFRSQGYDDWHDLLEIAQDADDFAGLLADVAMAGTTGHVRRLKKLLGVGGTGRGSLASSRFQGADGSGGSLLSRASSTDVSVTGSGGSGGSTGGGTAVIAGAGAGSNAGSDTSAGLGGGGSAAAGIATAMHLKRIEFAELGTLTEVGSGAFGVVYKGRWRTEDVCVKVLHKSSMATVAASDLLSELGTMARVGNHPRLVQLLGVCLTDDTGGGDARVRGIVTQFKDHGSVLDFMCVNNRVKEPHARYPCAPPSAYRPGVAPRAGLDEFGHCPECVARRPSTKTIVKIATQSAAGMVHLHSENVLHRDLAGRNVLVDKYGDGCLSDFGLSQDVGAGSSTLKTASDMRPIKWLSPEALEAHVSSRASDTYQFGCLLFELFTYGAEPWPDLSMPSAARAVLNGGTLDKYWPPGMDKDVRNIAAACWRLDPKARPTMEQVHEALSKVLDRLEGHGDGGLYDGWSASSLV